MPDAPPIDAPLPAAPPPTQFTPEHLDELARFLGSYGAYDGPKRRAAELLRARAADLRPRAEPVAKEAG